MVKGTDKSYGVLAVAFHWSSVIMIFIVVTLGFLLRFVNKQWLISFTTYHLAGGITLALIMVIRVSWIYFDTRPSPVENLKPLRKLIYKLNHILLYVFIFLVLLSGLSMLITTDLLASIGQSPIDDPKQVVEGSISSLIHRLSVYILIGLIVIHIVGVLSYQKEKGNVLQRMRL